MGTATLILWRHGATAWNAERRFQGSNADIPLNEQGLAHVQSSAPVVAAYHPEVMVASPLTRVRQTAAALEPYLNITCEVDDRLREINVGSWSGLTAEEVLAMDPEYAQARRERRDYRNGGDGETATELGTRVAAALSDWAAADRVTLVVGHGWALQMGVGMLLGWSYAQCQSLRVMDNCAISVVTGRPGSWHINRWNVPT